MIVLGFDTSAAHCAAALVSAGHLMAARAEPMTRGQAERLMPLLEEVLAEASLGWSDLDRIGVGTGPGNFTGIRIAVSAARGLALARDIPAIGVTGFEVIDFAANVGENAGDAGSGQAAAIAAPRGQVWLRRPGDAPALVPEAEARDAAFLPAPAAQAEAIARIAAAATPGPRPAPLYLRAADAAPARDTGPALLA